MMKQLRKCSAYVNYTNMGFGMGTTGIELISYRTPVALFGVIDGELIDAYGEVHECENFVLLLGEYYDCSNTTMSHVRKFCEDYLGVRVTISEIRQALKTDNVLAYRHGGNIMVYRCDW